MGEAFTFVSHICLHSVTLLVRARSFSLYGTQVVLRFVLQASEEPEEGAGCHDDSPDESVTIFSLPATFARTFFPPKSD